jgi:hypothetical protein
VRNQHKQEFSDQKFHILGRIFSSHYASGVVSTSSAEIYVQKTCAGTTLWQHTKISTTLKTLKGLKDSECKKGQLSSRPPVPYVPPTDLVTIKETPNTLKMKLPNGTIFNMSIFSRGNTEEYLAHIVAIIKQKGLNTQCRKLTKAVDKLAGTLKNLLKAAGSRTTVLLDDDVEARKLEIEHTQQMLQEAQKAHNEAITKMYELLRNLCPVQADPMGLHLPQDAQA